MCGELRLLPVFPEDTLWITGRADSATPPYRTADPLPSVLQADRQDPWSQTLRLERLRVVLAVVAFWFSSSMAALPQLRVTEPLMSEQGTLPGHPPGKGSRGGLVWEAQISSTDPG